MIVVAAVPGVLAGLALWLTGRPRRVVLAVALLVTLIALVLLYLATGPIGEYRIIPLPVE